MAAARFEAILSDPSALGLKEKLQLSQYLRQHPEKRILWDRARGVLDAPAAMTTRPLATSVRTTRVGTLVVDPEEAARVIWQLAEAVGDSGRTWGAIDRLTKASGMPPAHDAITRFKDRQRDPDSINRAWHWLVAAAEQARAAGQAETAVLAWYWADEWVWEVLPRTQVTAAFSQQVGFAPLPPPGTYLRLAALALDAVGAIGEPIQLATIPKTTTLRGDMLSTVLERIVRANGELSFLRALNCL